MARTFLLTGILIAAWAAGNHQAAAQYLGWCLISNESAAWSCAYSSHAQCTATLGGVGGRCLANPGYIQTQRPAQDPHLSGRKRARVARG
jgi:hypothetical protein